MVTPFTSTEQPLLSILWLDKFLEIDLVSSSNAGKQNKVQGGDRAH